MKKGKHKTKARIASRARHRAVSRARAKTLSRARVRTASRVKAKASRARRPARIHTKAARKAVKKAARILRKAGKKAVRAVLKPRMKVKAVKGRAKKAVKELEVKAPQPTVDEELARKRIATILSVSHVRQTLIELGGENALAIVRNFCGNKSDEEFAKKLKIKISDVRATLNKLHNEGLVNYIREKDSETGWYSYSWSLNHARMEKWANTRATITGAVGGEGTEYYFCPVCGTESITSFESAVNCEFRCERCNKMLEYIDQNGIVELFEKKK